MLFLHIESTDSMTPDLFQSVYELSGHTHTLTRLECTGLLTQHVPLRLTRFPPGHTEIPLDLEEEKKTVNTWLSTLGKCVLSTSNVNTSLN